jgi:hypothetical protein
MRKRPKKGVQSRASIALPLNCSCQAPDPDFRVDRNCLSKKYSKYYACDVVLPLVCNVPDIRQLGPGEPISGIP